MKLNRRYEIKGTITLKSGLHIGTTDEGFNIGGVDSPVIKDSVSGEPIIPGSTLKGKMGALLEWEYDQITVKGTAASGRDGVVAKLFGTVNKELKEKIGPTRLIFRDCFLTNGDMLQKNLGENIFTELKAENSINRITSTANPRFIERVVAGAEFGFELLVTEYDQDQNENLLEVVKKGLELLENTYIGGGGSRGSGAIKFEKLTCLDLSTGESVEL